MSDLGRTGGVPTVWDGYKTELTSVAVPGIIQFYAYLSVTGPESELGPPLLQWARNVENALHR